MLKTDVVRAQSAVQAFDFREILKEYGFSTGTKADVDAARQVVDGLVRDADTVMTTMVTDCDELGQNPYKRNVQVGGANVDFAMEIPLFPAGELGARINRVFIENEERKGRPVPDHLVLATKVKEGIAALARDAKYEVCCIDLHQDGAPQRIVLRDPAYAAEAATRTVENKGPDISDVGRILAAERIAQLDHSAETMGIIGPASTAQVQSLRATVKALVDGAVSEITQRLQALDANEVSPFASTPFRFFGKKIDHVNNDVVSWGWGRSIDKPVVVDVFNHYRISEALQQNVASHTKLVGQNVPSHTKFVDEYKFGDHVRRALVERLKSVPNLPLAAITTDRGDSYQQTRVVLVAHEVWARANGVALLPAPEKALPAPEAIAPVILPAKV